jgi:hypothetical protein
LPLGPSGSKDPENMVVGEEINHIQIFQAIILKQDHHMDFEFLKKAPNKMKLIVNI